MQGRNAVRASAVVVASLLLMSSNQAIGALGAEQDDGRMHQIPVTAVDTKPDGLQVAENVLFDESGVMPEATRDGLNELQLSSAMANITELEWRSEDHTVVIYAYKPEKIKREVRKLLPADQAVKFVTAAMSRLDMEAAVERLAAQSAQTYGDGNAIAYIAPAFDAGSFTVGLRSNAAEFRSSASLPSTFDGIDLVYETGAGANPATRVRNSLPIVSGGAMRSSTKGCTNGYPVMRVADGTYGNLSADHCGETIGQAWTWGSGSALVGNATGKVSVGDTDLEIFHGTAAGSFLPYVYIGSNNDSTNVLPIRGYFNAVVGDQICHSGSRSGMVCDNQVTSTGVFVCYKQAQCYWNGESKQISGVPASGNGDSGGPSFLLARRADGTVGAYGNGIISGMPIPNPGPEFTTCTGDPGYYIDAEHFRNCHTTVFFAPIVRWAPNQSVFSLLKSTN